MAAIFILLIMEVMFLMHVLKSLPLDADINVSIYIYTKLYTISSTAKSIIIFLWCIYKYILWI